MRKGPHAAEIPKLSKRKSTGHAYSRVRSQLNLQPRTSLEAALDTLVCLRSKGTRPLGIRVNGVRPSIVLNYCRACLG